MVGDGNNPLERLLQDNAEIRRNLDELLQRGIQSVGKMEPRQPVSTGLPRPPMPFPDIDGMISRGHSHWFGSVLNVSDREGNPLTDWEVAYLQL